MTRWSKNAVRRIRQSVLHTEQETLFRRRSHADGRVKLPPIPCLGFTTTTHAAGAVEEVAIATGAAGSETAGTTTVRAINSTGASLNSGTKVMLAWLSVEDNSDATGWHCINPAGGTGTSPTLPTEWAVATATDSGWTFSGINDSHTFTMDLVDQDSGGAWADTGGQLIVPVAGDYILGAWMSGYLSNDGGALSVDATIHLEIWRSGSGTAQETSSYRIHNPDDGSTHFGIGIIEWHETLSEDEGLYLRVSSPSSWSSAGFTVETSRLTARRVG